MSLKLFGNSEFLNILTESLYKVLTLLILYIYTVHVGFRHPCNVDKWTEVYALSEIPRLLHVPGLLQLNFITFLY